MATQQIPVFKSKKELVYDHLRREILRGTYQPGTRIVIDGLAAKLGVSQIPIREALQQLQAEGFIVIEPHIGPYVADLDVSVIREIFQLLEALEIISSQAACQRMSTTDLDAMEQILRKMDSLSDNLELWSQENVNLHYSICDWGGTFLVKSVMSKVLDQWARLRHYYLKDILIKRIDLSQQDHWNLFDALHARDVNRVKQVIRRHNQRALRAYVKHLKACGQIDQDQQLVSEPPAP